MVRVIAGMVVAMSLVVATGSAAAAGARGWVNPPECPPLDPIGSSISHYGPWDYTNPVHFREKLPVVERHHFNADVEMLIRGMTDTPGGDIGYTLRAFPNHHRALMAMTRLAIKEKAEVPKGAGWTIDCFFQRAFQIRKDDGKVWMILGMYRLLRGDVKNAVVALETAVKLVPTDGNAYYNLGLAYLDAKDYQKAMASAKAAYELGMTLPGLKNRLVREKKWDESVPSMYSKSAPAAPTAPSAPAASSAPDAGPQAASGDARSAEAAK